MSDSRTPTLSAKRISWLNNEEFKRNAGRDNARGTKGYQLSRGQRREYVLVSPKLDFRRTSTVRGVGDGEDLNWIKFRPPCFCALTRQFYSRGHAVDGVRIRGRAKFRVKRGERRSC